MTKTFIGLKWTNINFKLNPKSSYRFILLNSEGFVEFISDIFSTVLNN